MLSIEEQVDKIDVEELIKDFKVLNVDIFATYLKEVWKDLSNRSEDKNKGINRITFSKYYELPGIISTRLFAIFDKDKDNYLDLVEFIDGMRNLFCECFDNLSKMIFAIYDFDCDGKVSKEDIKTVLSYVPLTVKKSSEFLKYEK